MSSPALPDAPYVLRRVFYFTRAHAAVDIFVQAHTRVYRVMPRQPRLKTEHVIDAELRRRLSAVASLCARCRCCRRKHADMPLPRLRSLFGLALALMPHAVRADASCCRLRATP